MKNYCPKCRYFFGTIKSGKCPDCDVPLENAPQDPSAPQYRAPWRTNRDPKDRPGIYDAEGNAVADCDRSVMLSDSDKRQNARLIAAAPMMLDALRGVIGAWGGHMRDDDCGCADCEYLRPVVAAIAAASRHNA